LGATTESLDGPDTLLLLMPADDPKHRIQGYEKHLGAIRTVDGKYYKISASAGPHPTPPARHGSESSPQEGVLNTAKYAGKFGFSRPPAPANR